MQKDRQPQEIKLMNLGMNLDHLVSQKYIKKDTQQQKEQMMVLVMKEKLNL